MTKGTEPLRLNEGDEAPPRRLRWLTRVIKGAALLAGGGITLIAGMSVVGHFVDSMALQLVLAALPTIGLPLLLVDRLLPNNGTPRPGLATDVTAMLWMGTATAAVALGATHLQDPLRGEAQRLDAAGLPRVAWSVRWMAGASADPIPSPAEPAPEPESETEVGVAAPGAPQAAVPAPGAQYTPAPDQATRAELPPAELFRRWAPSVVTIRVDTEFGGGMGTGFVIDERGTIATNHHVVDGAKKLSVKLFDGTEIDRVELLELNDDDDLALIRIRTDQPLQPVALGNSDSVTVGEHVIVIGNPIGLEHTLTDGLVSSRRLWEGKKYIQMSAPVSPGNSGGPVFNGYGDVVGVTVAKLRGENLNLAVPIDKLKPMIKDSYPSAKDLGESRW